MLEHHAHLLPVQVEIQLLPVWAALLRDVHALEHDRARGRLLPQAHSASVIAISIAMDIIFVSFFIFCASI